MRSRDSALRWRKSIVRRGEAIERQSSIAKAQVSLPWAPAKFCVFLSPYAVFDMLPCAWSAHGFARHAPLVRWNAAAVLFVAWSYN